MGYKISYLWLYAINFLTTALLLSVNAMDLDVPHIIHWGENVIYCMGIWMLLSLWGKAFEAKEGQHYKLTLNNRITKLLTFSLLIIEVMAVAYITFDNIGFMLPSVVSLVIWLLVFSYLSLVSKDFLVSNVSVD